VSSSLASPTSHIYLSYPQTFFQFSNMKFITAALLITSAAAFAPSSVERTNTALSMDRRAAFGQIATAGAVLAGVPAIASADGAVSSASINRARGLYGERIVALAGAVSAGDFKAIAEEKNAFILFNSGAYANNKGKKAAAIAQTNDIFKAIRAGDKAAVKSAYDTYVKSNDITGLPAVDPQTGQGYCNDYDFRVRSKAGAIYVR
jgi:hypothetical protein